MGINGGRGIVSLGATLGGQGIATPRGSGFKVRFNGEGDISSQLKLTRFLSSTQTGEGSLLPSVIDFKSLSSTVNGQGSLVGELGGNFEFGNALQFDGVNDFVTCDFTGETAIKTTQAFTVAFWVKSPASLTDFIRLMGISTNSAGNRGEFMGFSQAGDRFDFFSSCQDGALKRITFTFSNNTWYHIAVSYNGSGFTTIGNYKIYVNGISQTVNVAGNFSSAAPNDILLGGHFNGFYNGEKTFDQFVFYDNYQASDAEILALYNSGDGQFPTTAITGGSPKVVWELDESGAATTATDSSGNGNDGTLNNFPASGMWVAH